MNLAGLGQIGTGYALAQPDATLAWQRVLAGRQALQQAARQQQAQEAFFASLITPAEGAIPQQGPPGGTPAMQQPQPPPAAAGGGPPSGGSAPIPAGALSPSATATPSAPGGSGAPPASGASATPAQPAGGLNIPDPVARLRQMAMQLKRANPQLDNATLAAALKQQVDMARGLAPDDKAMLQAEVQIMSIQQRADAAASRAQNAIDVANIRAEAAQQIADLRVQVAKMQDTTKREEGGANRASREGIAANAEANRNARAAARIDASNASAQVKAQYKQMAAQRAAIKDQISAYNAGTPGAPKKEEVAKLQQQLTALDAQIANFWSKNQTLPRPSELDRLGGDATPAAPQPSGQPAGAPQVGDVITSPAGKKFRVTGIDKDGTPLGEPVDAGTP